MKTKTLRDYVDRGFGFPVAIERVTLAEIAGDWVPLVDYDELERQVVEGLPSKPGRLTGSEVRFIRLHFKMSLSEFARALGVSHVAARKWEQNKTSLAGMQWLTEKNLRLFLLHKLNKSPRGFVKLFESLESKRPAVREPIRIAFSKEVSKAVPVRPA